MLRVYELSIIFRNIRDLFYSGLAIIVFSLDITTNGPMTSFDKLRHFTKGDMFLESCLLSKN